MTRRPRRRPAGLQYHRFELVEAARRAASSAELAAAIGASLDEGSTPEDVLTVVRRAVEGMVKLHIKDYEAQRDDG